MRIQLLETLKKYNDRAALSSECLSLTYGELFKKVQSIRSELGNFKIDYTERVAVMIVAPIDRAVIL